jgi:hypothetical protein
LIKAIFLSPSLNKLRFSSANVEKVVNPPSMPIKINMRIFEDTATTSKIPHKKSMVREPAKLTTRVLTGNMP